MNSRPRNAAEFMTTWNPGGNATEHVLKEAMVLELEILERLENARIGLAAVVNSLPETAKLEMQRAGSRTIVALTDEVARIARQVAGDAAAAEKNKTFVIAVSAAVAGCLVCVGIGVITGKSLNQLEISRIEDAARERVALAEKNTQWMATDEGKAALNLYATGVARKLSECTGDGWQRERKGALGLGPTVCFPRTNKNSELEGWTIKK